MALPRKTRPLKIGGAFTATNVNLPPHFFMGHPAKGFRGIGFLEAGLQAAVEAARINLTISLGEAIGRIAANGIRGVPSVTAPRAGISLTVINNVSELAKINVKTHILNAFRDSKEVAKATADAVFESNKGSDDQPLTNANLYRRTTQLFDYQEFSSGKAIGLRVRFKGNNHEIGKTFALNYGLRTGKPGESKLGFTA